MKIVLNLLFSKICHYKLKHTGGDGNMGHKLPDADAAADAVNCNAHKWCGNRSICRSNENNSDKKHKRGTRRKHTHQREQQKKQENSRSYILSVWIIERQQRYAQSIHANFYETFSTCNTFSVVFFLLRLLFSVALCVQWTFFESLSLPRLVSTSHSLTIQFLLRLLLW